MSELGQPHVFIAPDDGTGRPDMERAIPAAFGEVIAVPEAWAIGSGAVLYLVPNTEAGRRALKQWTEPRTPERQP
jgi:hypothetical protein